MPIWLGNYSIAAPLLFLNGGVVDASNDLLLFRAAAVFERRYATVSCRVHVSAARERRYP